MGLEGTAGVKETTGWAGGAALNGASPRFKAGQPQPGSASRAETPEEALAHIDMLYKSGSMSDLAGLLRGSRVFREAWLRMQQSPSAEPEPAKGEKRHRGKRQDRERRQPASGVGPGSRAKSDGYARVTGTGRDRGGRHRPDPATGPGAKAGALPAGTPVYLWKAALRAYRIQDQGYTQEKNQGLRLSLRA